MNVSANCPNQIKKIAAILSVSAGIIFLSDTRLNSDNNLDAGNLFKNLSNDSYTLYHNSRGSKRGVGILVSKKINYTLIDEFRDDTGNILGIVIDINDSKLVLISVYGPNKNEVKFFEDLDNFLTRYRKYFIVCAGDWNLTYSTDSTDLNIDILNMQAPPSAFRSRKLHLLCESSSLIDPYRILYPKKREYTFVPRTAAKNRSRLDFFLISTNLIDILHNCTISTSMLTTLFDHRCIFLSLKKLNPRIIKHNIDSSVFCHPRFNAVVQCAVAESYLQHADPQQPNIDIEVGLREIGLLISEIRTANELELELKENSEDVLLQHNYEAAMSSIKERIENFPDPAEFNAMSLTCDADVFLEVLMSNVRNTIISFQTWIKNAKNYAKNMLLKKINDEKSKSESNWDSIFELEKQLDMIVDNDLSERISQVKLYECLHAEKPSPIFLQLLKKKGEDDLESICDDAGNRFDTKLERDNFIVNSYEKIFEIPKEEKNFDFENCIERFLGPEICNNPIVKNSKITPAENLMLNAPLTIEELDLAVKKANKKSAPGVDGFSMKLIEICWNHFRLPLLNYATTCFEKGELTKNFRSACVRLIPKKGEVKKLKNWRPISLLSNMYKILSRAINERLNKIVNRVCSRAQKGYNNKRYTQEVLINVCKSIAFCREKELSGAVLAVDMSKAFDSLSHKFMNEVFKFFGFGPNITRWINVFGCNRQACIILDGGEYSRFFKLERGRPQGDNLSPNSFNFGEQILIYKIELNDRIVAIPRNSAFISAPPAPFSHEGNRETSKNESLADDNTTIMLATVEGLQEIKNNLSDFGKMSGLECNFDKTHLMPIGTDLPQNVLNTAKDLGFNIVPEICLLGMQIDNRLEKLNDNFKKVIDKVVSLISFWERFKLSFPGRIAIAKTFLVSQINYLGCIILPSNDDIDKLQRLINNFIRKNLRISDERIERSVNLGGAGFFNLKDFLRSQQCSWINRAFKFQIDNWRYDLRSSCPTQSILNIRKADINPVSNFLLYKYAESFENFLQAFTITCGNYRDISLFENGAFKTFDRKFFGADFYNNNTNVIRELTLSKCLTGNRIKTLAEFREENLPLTPALWFKLCGAILNWKNLYKDDGKKLTLERFFERTKKGSGPFRKTIQKEKETKLKVLELTNVKTFFGLTGVMCDEKMCYLWLGSWKRGSLPNDFAGFLFSCRNNTLPLNNRLSSYIKEVSPLCTFCVLQKRDPAPRESFLHCFFDCPVVKNILSVAVSNILTNPNGEMIDRFDIDRIDFRTLYWYGYNDDIFNHQTSFLTFFDSFRFIVYKHKQRCILPEPNAVLRELSFFLKKLCFASKPLKEIMLKNHSLTWFLRALG
jgi:exonuclease III